MGSMEEITKEILSAILNGIDEAIHVVDTNGITIFYNDVAARHDGLNAEEVLGRPLLNIFPSLNKSSSTLLKVMETKMPLYNQTQTFVNVHGKRIETVNTTLPIFINGNMIGAVEIAKDYSRIKQLSERLVDIQQGYKKITAKTRREQTKFTFADLLTKNPAFLKIKQEAIKLSKSDSPILVYGESGTGKELFVQGVHRASRRSDAPFVAQNCAAIPESLLESILFGTAKGSYTGAVERPGLLELADGGTLFLDELHTMAIELQAKLLRVLEDGMVRRVGSTKSFGVNVRIITAMNLHPHQAIKEGRLRSDLFYRLSVLGFELIPLRERPDDTLYLAEHFITLFNRKLGKQIAGFDKTVENLFLSYSWPGNVRELKHTVEYMMNICEGATLTENELPLMLRGERGVKQQARIDSLSLRENLSRFESELIERALAASNGNIKKAAALLEIPRQTLQYKIKKVNKRPAE